MVQRISRHTVSPCQCRYHFSLALMSLPAHVAWFRGIDFKTIHLQDPPFQPELKDPSDTRYFDDDINDEPLRTSSPFVLDTKVHAVADGSISALRSRT